MYGVRKSHTFDIPSKPIKILSVTIKKSNCHIFLINLVREMNISDILAISNDIPDISNDIPYISNDILDISNDIPDIANDIPDISNILGISNSRY